MKKTGERRRNILDLLIKSNGPVSTTQLVELYHVSKPIIDEDIRRLRDEGYNIVGISGHNGGYQLMDYKGPAAMVLDENGQKIYMNLYGVATAEQKNLLEYLLRLAEIGKIGETR